MNNQLTSWNFKYREELEDILSKFCIDKNQICLVGSLALSFRGIRSHGDVDFCAKSDICSKLHEYLQGNYISDNVNLVVGKYERIGVSDKELIDNSDYHELIDGFKVIRIELEFSIKNCRMWEKDHRDILIIEQYALNCKDWNWDLVLDNTSLLASLNKRSANLVNIETKDHLNKDSKSIRPLVKKVLRHGKVRIKELIKRSLHHKRILRKIGVSKYVDRYIDIKNKLNIFKTIESEDVILKYPTAKLLAFNLIEPEWMRIDIIVRYLAIEEYFGQNNIGFNLYKKMQENRLPQCNIDFETRFKTLIDSISNKGFDSYSPISVDLKLNLLDGSHRLAIANYFGISEVPIKIIRRTRPIKMYEYGLSWFKKHGFSEEEIDCIKKKQEDVFQKQGLYFYVILWPPAQEFFNEIENDLGKTYQVRESYDLVLEEKEFQFFIRNVYETDDIARWKIERKIHAMLPYQKKLRVLVIEIPDPKFRKKKINNHDISDVGAKIKAKYRSMYLSKIDKYIYDIIIHTADNYTHNLQIAKILKDCGYL